MASAIIAIENVNSEGLCQQQQKNQSKLFVFFFKYQKFKHLQLAAASNLARNRRIVTLCRKPCS